LRGWHNFHEASAEPADAGAERMHAQSAADLLQPTCVNIQGVKGKATAKLIADQKGLPPMQMLLCQLEKAVPTAVPDAQMCADNTALTRS
jgi:hypothetical protein